MEIIDNDYKQLAKLEESLWLPKTRFDREYMKDILSTDFFEFGRSGRIYDRDASLSLPFQEIQIKLPFKNFRIREIIKKVVLITYISEVRYQEVELTNRSSLWLKTSSGWKLKFHQGTPFTY